MLAMLVKGATTTKLTVNTVGHSGLIRHQRRGLRGLRNINKTVRVRMAR
jgi:hypothetical protein